MRIEHIIVGILAVLAIMSIVRAANRSPEDKAKPSWAVRALNSAGANVEARRLLPAVRELTARGVVAGASRTREAVSGRWTRGQKRRAEDREARRERAAELGEKVRDAASERGQAVVEAMERRWGQRKGDRPFIDRQAGDEPSVVPDDIPQGEASTDPEASDVPTNPLRRLLHRFKWSRREAESTVIKRRPAEEPKNDSDEDPGHDDGDRPVPCHSACPKCGSTIKTVIPAKDQDITVTCGCGHRITFYRAPHDVPEDHAVMRTATCVTCGTEHAATIPAGENGHMVVCACGTRLHFVRKPALNKEEPMSEINDADKRDTLKEAMQKVMSMSSEEMDAYLKAQAAQAGGGTANGAQTPVPLTWRPVAQRLADLKPDSDAELINFMSGEVAGMCAYAAGYEQLFETCTKSLGLDPRSVAGLGEFGDKIITVTAEMAMVHKRFVAMYQEVMKMVADGTVMPHRGRFFSGDVQV